MILSCNLLGVVKIATFNKIIKIQKLNSNTEKWEDFFISDKAKEKNYPYIHASINKSSGKEYFNARVEISSSTFNFNIRYCQALKDIIFETQSYRIVYENRVFDIQTVDDYKMRHQDLIIVGKFNGKKSFN